VQRPHYVFRNRPNDATIEYWTGTGWNREHVRAKQVDWAAGLQLITAYRSDADMSQYGFGMTPASML
jgi:hypothetical protein